jgi:hypothetical protein
MKTRQPVLTSKEQSLLAFLLALLLVGGIVREVRYHWLASRPSGIKPTH